MRIALLDDYQRVALDLADWSPVRALGTIDVFDRNLGGIEEAAEALRPYDVIGMMRERQPLPRALIERLPNLKLVIVTGARVRTIDFDATAERGITVCHTLPGGSHAATPELAWGLILATARHLPQECGNLRAGGWQQTLGTALSGSTLGLLGLGKLGRTMVPIARAFGMDCIAWSQNLTAEARDGSRRDPRQPGGALRARRFPVDPSRPERAEPRTRRRGRAPFDEAVGYPRQHVARPDCR